MEPETDRTEEFLGLLREHEEAIRIYLIAMVGNVRDAEELLQDTRLVMWKNFDQYECGTNFKAWGRKVAYHQTLAHRTERKRQQRRHELSLRFYESLSEATEMVADQRSEEFSHLRKCVSRLSDSHKEILRLRYDQEEEIGTIASSLRKTEGAIYRSLSRIRAQLKSCIERSIA